MLIQKRVYLRIYSVNLRIQSECAKIRTRKTPNTGSFCAVEVVAFLTGTEVLSLKLATIYRTVSSAI